MKKDRYEIIKLLGKGRTGGVYEAEDSNLGRKVALRRFFAQGDDIEVDVYKEEFTGVAQELSVLQHPNLLRVYDAGVDGDGAYIISQLLQGETLNDKITNEGPMPAWEVYDMAQQMLDALSTAHQEGYVHGAITPGSILLSPRARGGYLYVILDMGLSRLAPLIQGKDSILANMADPAILAPELFDGGVATVRGDLYMLGHILYMSLAGGHPFGGVSTKVAQSMHQVGLPPLQQYVQDVPEDFRLWIEKLVQFSPDNRPESAVEALHSIPKVPRPARSPANAVHPGTSQLTPGTAPQPQSPAGSNPGLDPRLTTGVIATSPNTATAGVGVLRLPPAKKDPKKLLIIGLGVLFVVIAITITVIIRGNNAAKMQAKLKEAAPDAPEEVAAYKPREITQPAIKPVPKPVSKPAPKPAPKPADNPSEPQKGIIAYFDAAGANPQDPKGWVYIYKRTQELIDDGWNIRSTNPNATTGIYFPISSKVNAMFDFGWKLTYVVRPIIGKHRFGFNFDNTLNPGWVGDKISFALSLEHTANEKVKLGALDSSFQTKIDKSIMVPYKGAEGWYNIVIEQKAKDKSGAYTVTIDGKLAFEDRFTQNIEFGQLKNSLYSLNYPKSVGDKWDVKEIKLETL